MARRRALLSVSDKTGITAFAGALVECGWEVLSTGGTARTLRGAGVDVTDVSEVTDHPEMMDGRVKTLHPAIHAGLLARRALPGDMAALGEQGYRTIDLVAVNLYPFRRAIAEPGVTLADAMENVDIGGPTLIRAAAKNHRDVWVVVDPADYDAVLASVATDSDASTAPDPAPPAAVSALRRRLAAKVFRHISAYDEAIAGYLEGLEESGHPDAGPEEPMAGRVTLELERRELLRYGENPDQGAAFYAATTGDHGIAKLEQIHGKALSYNNILDLDGALLSLAPFAFSPDPAVCIVKHTTPCGLAVSSTLADAFARARRTDPVSAFGSVIAVNRPVDRDTAAGIGSMFVECVVAPGFTPGALEVLTAKKNIRLLALPMARRAVPARWEAPTGRAVPARPMRTRAPGPGSSPGRRATTVRSHSAPCTAASYSSHCPTRPPTAAKTRAGGSSRRVAPPRSNRRTSRSPGRRSRASSRMRSCWPGTARRWGSARDRPAASIRPDWPCERPAKPAWRRSSTAASSPPMRSSRSATASTRPRTPEQGRSSSRAARSATKR